MKLFRELSEQEEREFRADARKNYITPINGVWHPVYQDECVKMNKEAANNVWPNLHKEQAK
jgi:hypothetical protein